MIERTAGVIPAPRRRPLSYSRWIAASVPTRGRVLNIGAGSGRSEDFRAVLRKDPYLVGIDPHPSLLDYPALEEQHQLSLEDFARTEPRPFDVAFSIYVLEHVERPADFIAASASVLRPGGVLFGLTLNRLQYFGLITWAATRLGVSESMLRRLKPAEKIAGYHFPTQYRLNTMGTIARHLDRAGFRSVEFRCFDQSSRYAWYLPPRLRGAAHAYSGLAYRIGRPSLMGHITFRAVR